MTKATSKGETSGDGPEFINLCEFVETKRNSQLQTVNSSLPAPG